MKITAEHEAHYREHGYAIVERFLSEEQIAQALANFDEVVPGWVAYAKDPANAPTPDFYKKPFPDQRGIPHFPYKGDVLNDLTFHPELMRFATHLGEGEEMYCEQSHLSYKASGQGDFDQAHHLDYGNHTLAYPPDVPKFWQTAYLYYFTDVTLESGPTAVCSKQHYPERILVPGMWKKEDRPELYENEVKVTVPAGSLLVYSMRTFHRGTAIVGENHGRLGMFVTYAPKACRWAGIVGWPVSAGKREFRAWVERASVVERSALGFPEPGHEFWTDETLDGVGARFPGMDMTPYREAVQG